MTTVAYLGRALNQDSSLQDLSLMERKQRNRASYRPHQSLKPRRKLALDATNPDPWDDEDEDLEDESDLIVFTSDEEFDSFLAKCFAFNSHQNAYRPISFTRDDVSILIVRKSSKVSQPPSPNHVSRPGSLRLLATGHNEDDLTLYNCIEIKPLSAKIEHEKLPTILSEDEVMQELSAMSEASIQIDKQEYQHDPNKSFEEHKEGVEQDIKEKHRECSSAVLVPDALKHSLDAWEVVASAPDVTKVKEEISVALTPAKKEMKSPETTSSKRASINRSKSSTATSNNNSRISVSKPTASPTISNTPKREIKKTPSSSVTTFARPAPLRQAVTTNSSSIRKTDSSDNASVCSFNSQSSATRKLGSSKAVVAVIRSNSNARQTQSSLASKSVDAIPQLKNLSNQPGSKAIAPRTSSGTGNTPTSNTRQSLKRSVSGTGLTRTSTTNSASSPASNTPTTNNRKSLTRSTSSTSSRPSLTTRANQQSVKVSNNATVAEFTTF